MFVSRAIKEREGPSKADHAVDWLSLVPVSDRYVLKGLHTLIEGYADLVLVLVTCQTCAAVLSTDKSSITLDSRVVRVEGVAFASAAVETFYCKPVRACIEHDIHRCVCQAHQKHACPQIVGR